MKTRVQKWGNSLAVRIPSSFAVETRLEADTVVELTLDAGRLVIEAAHPAIPTLDELLAGITDENLHGEWNTGPAVGREVW